MTRQQQPPGEDRIQPRSHAKTEKIENHDRRLALAPDEVTIPTGVDDAEPMTCAELIRRMSASYQHHRPE